MVRSLEVMAIAGLVLFGCVENQPDDVEGKVNFIGGYPKASPDYVAPVGTISAGTGASPIGPAAGQQPVAGGPGPVVGTGPATAGSAAPTMTAGTGAGGTGGSGASTGTAGAAATAGTGGGSDGEGGSTAEPAPTGAPGSLMVSVMSAAVGGRYAPRNVGAIWIETGSGEFVKTIERWAGIRANDLRAWNQASGGWGFSFFGPPSSPDAVDAVTAATLRGHQMHSPRWAFKDGDGMVVPDGPYKVVLEVADGSAARSEVMFTKGPMPQTVMGSSGGRGYTGFTVTYAP